MTQPLALVFYERLLPGSQLVNRLQDLGYRVHPVPVADLLASTAESEKALLVFADLESPRNAVCEAIVALRKNPATAHVPVISFASDAREELRAAANIVGAIAVSDTVLLGHLPVLLNQALSLD